MEQKHFTIMEVICSGDKSLLVHFQVGHRQAFLDSIRSTTLPTVLLDSRLLTSQGPRSIKIEVSGSAFLKISCSFFVCQRYGFVARAVVYADVCYHAIPNIYGNPEFGTQNKAHKFVWLLFL